MYRCERCGQTSKPSEGLNKVVVQTRSVVYYEKYPDENGVLQKGKEVGRGFEAVKEEKVCNNCLKKEK